MHGYEEYFVDSTVFIIILQCRFLEGFCKRIDPIIGIKFCFYERIIASFFMINLEDLEFIVF